MLRFHRHSSWSSAVAGVSALSQAMFGTCSSAHACSACGASAGSSSRAVGGSDAARRSLPWRSGAFLTAADHSAALIHSTRSFCSSAMSAEGGKQEEHRSQFAKSWEKEVEKPYGRGIVFPKQIIWLAGAPGSGKGTNMGFLKRIRGIPRDITMSDLIAEHPECRAIMDQGGLVPDHLVCDLLLRAIFDPEEASPSGVIIDGFPRSEAQVDFIKEFNQKLMELYQSTAFTPDPSRRFPKPSPRYVLLYVDEQTSVHRQMSRFIKSREYNVKRQDCGAGDLMEERPTDQDEQKCRLRYKVFRDHKDAFISLQYVYPESFCVIDATGSPEQIEAQMANELRYQSSHDLDAATYAAVTQMPLAKELVELSRQNLVQRLDGYCTCHFDTFQQVMQLLRREVVPVLHKCAMAGHADFCSSNPMFDNEQLTTQMVIDVLTDRGFSVSHTRTTSFSPRRMDVASGELHNKLNVAHKFHVTFPGGTVRDVQSLRAAASRRVFESQEAPLVAATLSHSKHQLIAPLGSERAQSAALG